LEGGGGKFKNRQWVNNNSQHVVITSTTTPATNSTSNPTTNTAKIGAPGQPLYELQIRETDEQLDQRVDRLRGNIIGRDQVFREESLMGGTTGEEGAASSSNRLADHHATSAAEIHDSQRREDDDMDEIKRRGDENADYVPFYKNWINIELDSNRQQYAPKERYSSVREYPYARNYRCNRAGRQVKERQRGYSENKPKQYASHTSYPQSREQT
jgi:hypothetical protein